MRSDVLAYIQKLSLRDGKSISQKGLKLMEEVGELAKAVLPFENAQATTHRFVTPEKVLEEVVDSILVALSIAYTLGYSDEDITREMIRKSDYWAELLARESRMTDETPYEIHVTVAEAPCLETFVSTCRGLGVKPIVLDLQRKSGGAIKDVMTSSVCFGKNSDAYQELNRIAEGLSSAGFNVVRRKIETVPWHPAAPSSAHKNPVMPESCYFESHLAVRLADDNQRLLLETLAREHNCHLSRNVFKRHEDGSATVMLTYRDYHQVYEVVKAKVDEVLAALAGAGLSVDKHLIEFSLYDSKASHDGAWLKG